MPEDSKKKAILAGALAAILAGVGIGAVYAMKKEKEGEKEEEMEGEIQGSATIEVTFHSPEETAELVESGEVIVVRSFTPPNGMIVRNQGQQYKSWKITIDGVTRENVGSVGFRPKVRHVGGGELPLNVTVEFYVNNERKITLTGEITSEGQEITLDEILWIPEEEGTYDLLFVATAVDQGNRVGTAQASYTAKVESIVTAPEIEIEIEIL